MRGPLTNLAIALFGAALLAACGGAADRGVPAGSQTAGTPAVLAIESFLADVAQNVAGDRLRVETLMPLGLDPHAFEPTPQDVARIAESQVLIANGAGFEEWLQEVLDNAGGERRVIEAAVGLRSRVAREGEETDHHAAGDPHFWLDPTKVITYTNNIRDGLIQADPAGEEIYTRNAEVYIARLRELDSWIAAQTAQIAPERRQIVTNHESFGYFADRYGLRVIGTVIPSVSTSAAPSAQQLARLADHIRASGAQVLFLETGSNPQLARQLAEETGITVVTDLYSHSISAPGGPAPTYIDMMRYNTNRIVESLK